MDRRAIEVSGIVQGVGFRPFIHDLATRLGLNGFVKNQTGGVLIEVEGEGESLDRFCGELITRPPPLARIDGVACSPRDQIGDSEFRIESSEVDRSGAIFISPDVATCDDCLRELFDPRDRRYRYPFLNCTNCGPRLTIVQAAPYDRVRTTMASFAMCEACRAEYEDPRDRRYHAQPIACPRCGPRLAAIDCQGQPIETDAALALGIALLKDGKIAALKGLGGYHLACLAGDVAAVAELRKRKHRDQKPLAIMVKNVLAARAICEVNRCEEALLTSPQRPIVLLPRRPGAAVAPEVAPGNPDLGVMLPYTPLHHLILNDLGGAPLVLTSGNASDEPIAYNDNDALARLAGIADLFLTHDRQIHLRCDDSVTRILAGSEMSLRRSRGYAPVPIELPSPCGIPILALGGQMKVTFALGRGRHAFLSHHLGDLDYYAAYRAYVEAIAHFERLFALEPELIVHDLHPDYASTRYARQREGTVPLLAVQHHHAHLASCMAEHGLNEPVIGVAFDGTGFGSDGAIWGGEFLVGDYRGFRRAAHLRYVAMPGGERAIHEPWRMAVAHLRDAGASNDGCVRSMPAATIRTVEQMIEKGFNTPLTSSAGRLFDAVAALVGVRGAVTYEGQAAMELEWLATGMAASGAYPFECNRARGAEFPGAMLVVDTRPLIRAVVRDVAQGIPRAMISRRFHTTMVELIACVCDDLRRSTQLDSVVLSGGVFMNALLSIEATGRLEAAGFRVYRHGLIPPNDGGLSLGQLAIAAALAAGENAGKNGPD
jgi:hydrogenase maturation protein HypF